jgi:hypothetical protein
MTAPGRDIPTPQRGRCCCQRRAHCISVELGGAGNCTFRHPTSGVQFWLLVVGWIMLWDFNSYREQQLKGLAPAAGSLGSNVTHHLDLISGLGSRTGAEGGPWHQLDLTPVRGDLDALLLLSSLLWGVTGEGDLHVRIGSSEVLGYVSCWGWCTSRLLVM